ncbi:MAG: anthranilate phosphoribosyltransferase [Anaerohalosphaeraceae bacterium]|nr:anthranilate phosphoribosyltransferase [Anaerohalosphaeraceae bacterium]
MAKITEYLEILLDGGDLSYEQAKALLDVVFAGEVADVQIAAFLAAMRMKTAVPSEFAGLAQSLRDHAVKVEVGIDNLIDTCGTGGAPLKTFNISTAAAFVAAGAGAYVAKHGNRGITSKCGSADVLEAMGVKIDCGPKVVAESIRKARIGFMFAPMHHPAMKFVQPIRKSLDFRTAFNLLGPMANPAGANAQVMGVADIALLDRIADTLNILGSKRAMVVHGNGLDEISITSKTSVVEIRDNKKTSYEIDPVEFGITAPAASELIGGSAGHNATTVKDVLSGKNKGPARDVVLLNAAAAIVVAGITDDMQEGFKKASESVDGGSAIECMKKMIEITNSGDRG